jgi:putative transposase
MARLARVVVPGVPLHIIQRGSNHHQTFFSDKDYKEYLYLMADWCNRCAVEVLAYCLMPNHIHLVCVTRSEDGLRKAIGEAHRRYTRHINTENGWTGHLWQGRFASYPVDDNYLMAVTRYIVFTPVRLRLVKKPENYRWSSCRAHLTGRDDILVKVKPLLARTQNFRELLENDLSQEQYVAIRSHEKTGRPLGSDSFVAWLEEKTARTLRKQKPGPKK